MLRWQTAGESHGEALVAMIEGLPAGIHVTTEDIVGALARRRLGYGRGARMKFEQDKVRMLTGVRFGETIGSPVAIEIANTEWPKWTEVMTEPEGSFPNKYKEVVWDQNYYVADVYGTGPSPRNTT